MTKKRCSKKAQINSIIGLVIGVGVAVMMMIFVGVLAGKTFQMTESDISAIGNNAVTMEFGTNTLELNHHNLLVHSDVHKGQDDQYVNVSYTNGTVLKPIQLNMNFVFHTDADGYVDYWQMNTTNSSWNNTEFAFNYTWGKVEIRSGIQNSVLSSFDALNQTGSLMPIIVLAIVIVIILGLVMGMMGSVGGGLGGTVL